MRPDMERVVTERPRHNHKLRYKDTTQRARLKSLDHDDVPRREKMNPAGNKWGSGVETKSFSDLISPLYKFFRSNVGKNWDKIWSSICEHLPAKTLSAYHIRKQHLEKMIEVTPLLIDGKYYSNNWNYQSRRDRVLRPFFKNEFYVDKQGCIREGKITQRGFRARDKKEEPITSFTVYGNTYHKTNGCWFLSKSRVVETRQWKSYAPVVTRHTWGTTVHPAEGMSRGYQPAKGEPDGEFITVKETVWLPSKQLNTKELLALGLVNDRKAA